MSLEIPRAEMLGPVGGGRLAQLEMAEEPQTLDLGHQPASSALNRSVAREF
jgi:hypothetical protein